MKIFVVFFIFFASFNISTFAAGDIAKEVNHYLIQARIRYDNSRYEEAIELCNKALALDPQSKEALDFVEKAQEKIYQYDIATRDRLRKPENENRPEGENKTENEKKAEPYILQGKKYYNKERFNWAASEWEKALKIDPANKEALNYLERARVRLKQKNSEQIPIESDMILNAPVPDFPTPIIEKPRGDTITLDEAAEIGLKNHLPVQIALEQVKLARFKEKESFRALFPDVGVRFDTSRGVVTSKDYVGKKYQLRVQHPLYHGGELKFTWEQAKVNLKIAQENYDKTKEDYILQLAKAYYDYVKAIRNFNVQETLLKDLEGYMAMAKKEHDSGVSVLVDFLNVQSQYNQAYYSSLSSENSLSLAKLNFLQLLSLDQDPGVNIKIDTELVFKEININLEECVKLAYERRTDLKINDLSLKAAELGEKVTKSQQSPKIDFTGTLGKSGEVLTPGKLQMSDDWFFGAKASVPWGPNTMNYSYTREDIAPSVSVFGPTKDEINSLRFNILDNLGSYTETQRSEVTRQQAYSDLMKGKQIAATEVREAYFNYQESALKVKNSIQNKDLYQRELSVIKERRSMDEAATQDIVSAKVKLAGEEINYTAAVIENKIAIAKLNKAIGIRDYFK